MSSSAQGIPGLPDLTHPIELVQFGTHALKASLLLVFLIVALGVAIAGFLILYLIFSALTEMGTKLPWKK
ncbi:MAG: hypothetical protein V7K67_07305 [Nostoc sp.]|uniref:hypothetical protein n=1 Tax=Nostoc sp. TaxID=1180 RepID=UPI002FF5B568